MNEYLFMIQAMRNCVPPFVLILTANPTLKDYSGVDLHTTSVKYVLYRHVLICLIITYIFIVRVLKTRESKYTSSLNK